MHRMRRGCLMVGFLVWLTFGSQPSVAQYTANFQTNIISGVTSNWTGDYIVGNGTFADVLQIQGGGQLIDNNGTVGYQVGSSNNTVLVMGVGSVWSNRFTLYLGYQGRHNSLVISNGARVFDTGCAVGTILGSSNNSVLVTGSGSALNNVGGGGAIALDYSGSGGYNSLLISNGAQVTCDPDSGYNVVGGGSSSNSVVITDPGSVWSGVYVVSVGVGTSGVGNTIVVRNGGAVFGNSCYVLNNSNSVLVTDTGSIWNNRESFFVGSTGSGCSMVVSNGGVVASLGTTLSGSNTAVVVTGTGSVWSNGPGSSVEINGSGGDSLLIGDGGQVIDAFGYVGSRFADTHTNSFHSARVADGAVWRNNGLHVGYYGSTNALVVAGGSVIATNLTIGFNSAACDNLLQLDSGSVTVTNATHDAVLEVRRGKLVLNGGTLQADTLVITNPCASLVHTGGTLLVGSVVLDPNTFRITSITPRGNDMMITWMMGPGATNTLQATAGNGSGGYKTNGFKDIFVVTNNTTVGTVTNYLDLGAGTNTPARYYRARLAP